MGFNIIHSMKTSVKNQVAKMTIQQPFVLLRYWNGNGAFSIIKSSLHAKQNISAL